MSQLLPYRLRERFHSLSGLGTRLVEGKAAGGQRDPPSFPLFGEAWRGEPGGECGHTDLVH